MRDKELYGVRVYNVAQSFGITMTSVREIIDSFVSECRLTLKSGSVLRLGDLATIRPNIIKTEYVPTLGYLSKLVADKKGLPYYTVYSVVNEYLNTVKDDILAGKNADIRKLVSFHSISLGFEQFKVNCVLSASVRNDLRSCDVPMSARVSFSKILRSMIKEGVDKDDW